MKWRAEDLKLGKPMFRPPSPAYFPLKDVKLTANAKRKLTLAQQGHGERYDTIVTVNHTKHNRWRTPRLSGYLTAPRGRQRLQRAGAGSGSKKTSATSERAVREPPFSFLRGAAKPEGICMDVSRGGASGQFYGGTKRRCCELHAVTQC